VVLGVVPVGLDDADAPCGSRSLRRLSGRTLVVRAVEALLEGGPVDLVTVAVESALRAEVERELIHVKGPVLVVDEAAGPGLLRAVLAATPGAQVALVHHPIVTAPPPALFGDVLAALRAAGPGCAGVIPVRPVTDSLKRVSADGLLTGSADRSRYSAVHGPQAYRTAALGAPDCELGDGPARLPGLLLAAGARVAVLAAPGEPLVVRTDDDLAFAQAFGTAVPGRTPVQGIR